MRRKTRKQNIVSRAERAERLQRRGTRIMTDLSVAVILACVVLGIVYRKQITVENIVSIAKTM